MKIIKIPITEQNREVYWSRNKDKKAWEKLMSECPSMTSKEFWNNEWEEFDKEEISTHWYFIVGKRLHQSYCCDHCVNHWGIGLCGCGSGQKVGKCECGSQKAHDILGVKYDSFGAILKNFG